MLGDSELALTFDFDDERRWSLSRSMSSSNSLSEGSWTSECDEGGHHLFRSPGTSHVAGGGSTTDEEEMTPEGASTARTFELISSSPPMLNTVACDVGGASRNTEGESLLPKYKPPPPETPPAPRQEAPGDGESCILFSFQKPPAPPQTHPSAGGPSTPRSRSPKQPERRPPPGKRRTSPHPGPIPLDHLWNALGFLGLGLEPQPQPQPPNAAAAAASSSPSLTRQPPGQAGE